MTYHTKALCLTAALALSPMAASAATVDINIQSFGALVDLSDNTKNPNIADALAARDAFIGGATIQAFEGFEGFTACDGSNGSSCASTGNTTTGLSTAVGTFDKAGSSGTGSSPVAPVEEAVVKNADAGKDSHGRYNVAADSSNNHSGGNWLDSNDWTSIEWDIPGASGLTNFDRIAFFLTDVNDSGNVDFKVTAGGIVTEATKAISGDVDDGMLNLVTMQFDEIVTGDVFITLSNGVDGNGNRSDGIGIDSITVAAVPLPAAGLLLLGGLGGLGGVSAMRRRKRAA